jgi:hypothetical protein
MDIDFDEHLDVGMNGMVSQKVSATGLSIGNIGTGKCSRDKKITAKTGRPHSAQTLRECHSTGKWCQLPAKWLVLSTHHQLKWETATALRQLPL